MRIQSKFTGYLSTLVAGFLLLASTPVAFAEKPLVEIPGAPHLLPIDTLAYIRFDNADEIRLDFAKTSVAKMLRDPELRPLVSDTYQTLAQLFEEFGSELGITLDDLLAIPSGQIAAAAVPGNLSPDQISQIEENKSDESTEAIKIRLDRKRRNQNSISGWFMIDAGENIRQLRELIAKLEKKLQSDGYVERIKTVDQTRLIRWLPPRAGRPEIEFFERDGSIVLGIGHATASRSLDLWNDKSDEKTFADRADFAAIMSRCLGAEETRPQMTFFVDPYQLVGRIVKRNSGAAFFWPLVESLGFNKIRGFGGSSFQGGETFEAISHLHVLIDPPRDGFFGVLRPETGDTMPPPWVPENVTSYTSLNWDFDRTYTNLDKIIAKFRGPQPLKGMIEDPVQGAIDISIPEEIKNTLGGRYVTCRRVELPIKINSGVQMHALSLKDPVRAQEILSKIRSRFPERMKVDSVAGQTVYVMESRRRRNRPDGSSNQSDIYRKTEPGLLILNDWMIFSDSRKFLESAIRASKGSQSRLLNNLQFELVASELGGKLGGEEPFMISFLRGADFMGLMYELARSDSTRKFLKKQAKNNGGAQKAMDLLSRNELPPFEKFEKYFAPSGTFAYDEPGGIHFGSFTLRADSSDK